MSRVCRLRGGPSFASDFRFAGIDRGASNEAMDVNGDESVSQRTRRTRLENRFVEVGHTSTCTTDDTWHSKS